MCSGFVFRKNEREMLVENETSGKAGGSWKTWGPRARGEVEVMLMLLGSRPRRREQSKTF